MSGSSSEPICVGTSRPRVGEASFHIISAARRHLETPPIQQLRATPLQSPRPSPAESASGCPAFQTFAIGLGGCCSTPRGCIRPHLARMRCARGTLTLATPGPRTVQLSPGFKGYPSLPPLPRAPHSQARVGCRTLYSLTRAEGMSRGGPGTVSFQGPQQGSRPVSGPRAARPAVPPLPRPEHQG